VIVHEVDMKKYCQLDERLKGHSNSNGAYICFKDNNFIIVEKKLKKSMKAYVILHEIGHAITENLGIIKSQKMKGMSALQSHEFEAEMFALKNILRLKNKKMAFCMRRSHEEWHKNSDKGIIIIYHKMANQIEKTKEYEELKKLLKSDSRTA